MRNILFSHETGEFHIPEQMSAQIGGGPKEYLIGYSDPPVFPKDGDKLAYVYFPKEHGCKSWGRLSQNDRDCLYPALAHWGLGVDDDGNIVSDPELKTTAFKKRPAVPQDKPNPWRSGSFYLALVIVILTLLLVVANAVSIVALPIVIIGTLLLVSIIGAFQLRQDSALSEENFLSLMLMALKQIPLIGPKK